MARLGRVCTGGDGRSHMAEAPLALSPFLDTDGAHGEATPVEPATRIGFRVAPPGSVLDWHCAPRRQFPITLSGTAEIEVGEGAAGGAGDHPLAEHLTGQGHIARAVGDRPRLDAIVPLGDTSGARRAPCPFSPYRHLAPATKSVYG